MPAVPADRVLTWLQIAVEGSLLLGTVVGVVGMVRAVLGVADSLRDLRKEFNEHIGDRDAHPADLRERVQGVESRVSTVERVLMGHERRQ